MGYPMHDATWAVAAAFWLAGLILVQVAMRFVITYELTQHELCVLMFGRIRLSSMRLTDVASVQILTFRRLLGLSLRSRLFWAARAGNCLYARRVVVVQRRHGRGRALVISPDQPEDFARRLEGRIMAARGSES